MKVRGTFLPVYPNIRLCRTASLAKMSKTSSSEKPKKVVVRLRCRAYLRVMIGSSGQNIGRTALNK